MARSRDPGRLDRAQREGVKARLAVRMGTELAEAWLEAWEREAGREPRGTGFWDDGYLWIEAQRRSGMRTPRSDAAGDMPADDPGD